MERLFMLTGLSDEGQIAASWVAICERCLMLDGPETLRQYRTLVAMTSQLQACGVGDSSIIVVHHNGVEVRHGPEVDVAQLAFLPWKTRVDYRAASEPGYSWH